MEDLIARKKLFDVFTRQTVFIEQVRANEFLIFNDVLLEIELDFQKHLSKLKYESLSEMNKSQIQAFIRALKGSQTVIYSRYQQSLLKRLQKLTAAVVDQTVVASVSLHAHFEDEENEEDSPIVIIPLSKAKEMIVPIFNSFDGSSLNGLFMTLTGAAMLSKAWSAVVNAPLPASGALPVNYINTAIASSMMRVSQSVLQSWANKLTVKEMAAQIVGSKSTGEGNPNLPGGTKSSELTKIRNVMGAVLSTTVQHTAEQSIANVQSAIWPEYDWLSVMDDVTSAICRNLNGKTFRFGAGPIPPAHPHCRSHIVPKGAGWAEYMPPSLSNWLKAQSMPFLVGIFGARIARQLVSETSGTLNLFANVKPITIDQFAEKLNDLF